MAGLPAMRLYTSNASPFCLKVMVLAHELGLAESSLSLDYSVKPLPTLKSTPHSALVPHGKIPALVVTPTPGAPQTVLFGSEVVCQYLDSLAGNKALPPPGTLERFEALTTEALASAIKDAALALRYERIERSKDLHWQDWIEGQLSKITRSIPVLAKRKLPDPAADVFGLDGWYKRVQERESWKQTPFAK
ncbi:hypothetical protein JCM10213_004782 [Rhodosporidiobolus nylandii]